MHTLFMGRGELRRIAIRVATHLHNLSSGHEFRLLRWSGFALVASFAVYSPEAMAQECRFLSGEAHRQCMHAEAARISEANRERAAQQRQERLRANGQDDPRDAQSSDDQCDQEDGCPDAPAPRSSLARGRPTSAYRNQQNIAAQQAAQQREEEAARLAALPDAGPKWTKKLEAIAEMDSKGWISNVFDKGSMHNVKIVNGAASSTDVVLRGDYSYNRGAHGWVEVQITHGRPSCLRWWDGAAGCHGLRTAESAARTRALAGAVVASALSDSGSSGGGGCQMEVKTVGNDGRPIRGCK
jgi:hypothetical protein